MKLPTRCCFSSVAASSSLFATRSRLQVLHSSIESSRSHHHHPHVALGFHGGAATSASFSSLTTRSRSSSSTITALNSSNNCLNFMQPILRGGTGEFFATQKASSLDISRVRMRLEGLMAYATLCALLANGCLRLYSSVQEPKQQEQQQEETSSSSSSDHNNNNNNNSTDDSSSMHNKQQHRRNLFAYDAFYVFIVTSILSGSYTTVVYTLIALFSKIALGRGYDAQFLNFWAATAGLRESGFEAFMASLVCFELAFVLSVFLKTQRGARQQRRTARSFIVLLACTLTACSFARWYEIMRLVSTMLFPLRAETQYF